MMFLLMSCAGVATKPQPTEKEILSSEPNTTVQAKWTRVIQLAQQAKWSQVLTEASQFIKKYPNSPLLSEAYFLSARAYYATNEYDQALKMFNYFLKAYPSNFRTNEAYYGTALSYFRTGELERAGKALDSVQIDALPSQDQFYAHFLAGKLAITQNKTLKALEDFVQAYEAAGPANKQRESLYELIVRTLESRASLEDLIELADEREGKFPEELVLYQIARRLEVQGDVNRSRSYYEKLVSRYPSMGQKPLIQKALTRFDRQEDVTMNHIGVLLPLTGDYASYARSALNGIQLAADVFGQSPNQTAPYVLHIRDTRGNPDIAREAFRELVDEKRVSAIVGPMTSREADFVAEYAQGRHVPTFVLSQKPGESDSGSYVFRSAMTLKLQAKTMAQYAAIDCGLKRFAIIYPNDPYGTELATEFWHEVERLGGKVTAVESYPPGEVDFQGPLKRMIGTYYENARKDEFQKIRDAYAQDKFVDPRQKPGLPPVVDFEALYVPDGYKAVGQIAPSLAYFDVLNVMLLGSNAWNSEHLIERAWPHIEGAAFVDGFFPESTRPGVAEFVEQFKRIFNRSPNIHAAQGYDAFRMVALGIQNTRSPDRGDLRDQIAHIKNYSGPSGLVLGFDESGDAKKDLFILKAVNKKFVEQASSR